MSDGNLLEGASLIPRILSLFKPFGFSFSVRSLFCIREWTMATETGVYFERAPATEGGCCAGFSARGMFAYRFSMGSSAEFIFSLPHSVFRQAS